MTDNLEARVKQYDMDELHPTAVLHQLCARFPGGWRISTLTQYISSGVPSPFSIAIHAGFVFPSPASTPQASISSTLASSLTPPTSAPMHAFYQPTLKWTAEPFNTFFRLLSTTSGFRSTSSTFVIRIRDIYTNTECWICRLSVEISGMKEYGLEAEIPG